MGLRRVLSQPGWAPLLPPFLVALPLLCFLFSCGCPLTAPRWDVSRFLFWHLSGSRPPGPPGPRVSFRLLGRLSPCPPVALPSPVGTGSPLAVASRPARSPVPPGRLFPLAAPAAARLPPSLAPQACAPAPSLLCPSTGSLITGGRVPSHSGVSPPPLLPAASLVIRTWSARTWRCRPPLLGLADAPRRPVGRPGLPVSPAGLHVPSIRGTHFPGCCRSLVPRLVARRRFARACPASQCSLPRPVVPRVTPAGGRGHGLPAPLFSPPAASRLRAGFLFHVHARHPHAGLPDFCLDGTSGAFGQPLDI